MATISVDTELSTINCGQCGGIYAINERYRRQKEEKGGTWNCPYCKTGWGYAKSKIQELRESIAEKERVLALERSRHDQTRAKLHETEKSVIAYKAASTRAKKRSAAGVCPCCHRTVKQMAQHIKSKHPEYIAEVAGNT